MALVTLTSCDNYFQAELIKGNLASEGIPCVIQGENISSLYGGINAMPIRVLVNEEQLETALAIIKAPADEEE